MGCASTKLNVEAAMEEVSKGEFIKGLPSLHAALKQASKDPNSQSSESKAPAIVELLAKTMETLNGQHVDEMLQECDPVIAACGSMAICIRLLGDRINGKHLKNYHKQNSVFFTKAVTLASEICRKDFSDHMPSNFSCITIANLTIEIYKLPEANEYKSIMNNAATIAAAVVVLRQDAGVKDDAQKASVQMLSSYVDQDFGEVQGICDNMDLVLAYAQEKKKQKLILAQCTAVMEACLKHGKDFPARGDVEKFLENSPSQTRA